jgi:putative addiction module component (TIGR02574 family)
VTAEQVLADAATLSVSERLRIVQAIWDSLPESVVPTPSSEIKSEFDRRMHNYRQKPESAMTLEELRRRLDADRAE